MAGFVFLVFFVCLARGYPIIMCMIGGALTPLAMGAAGASGIAALIRGALGGANSPNILCLPLFIFAGVVMAEGGISKKLFDVFAYFVGNKTGGIPCAVIITCLFYGAISSSGAATAAAIGAMTIPLLVELGYDPKFSAATVAVAGGLGVIIPPSGPFMMYGMATDTSIGSLFIAGILPGILVGCVLMVYAVAYCKIHGEDKAKIQANYKKITANGFFPLFKDSFWALLSPVIILGGIYAGIVTPTEAAAVSVFYSLIISLFVYKTVTPKGLFPLMVSSVKSAAPICFLLAFATAFGRTLSLIKAADVVQSVLTSVATSRTSFLIVVIVVFFLLGMVMDTGPAIIILAPIICPIAVKYGIDPVHLGVIMVCNLAIGLVTPPFGLNLFVTSPIAGRPPMSIGKEAIPYIGAFLAALTIIAFVPQFSLLLI